MSDLSPQELEKIEAETRLATVKADRETLGLTKEQDKWDVEQSMSYDHRTLYVYGIDTASVNQAITLLHQWANQDRLKAERPDYTLRISSPGGLAIAGF